MRLFYNIELWFTAPKILFLYKKNLEGDRDFGFHVTNLDTGLYFSDYDYGYILKLQILGFGVYIWWM